jgi:hypothetical protein
LVVGETAVVSFNRARRRFGKRADTRLEKIERSEDVPPDENVCDSPDSTTILKKIKRKRQALVVQSQLNMFLSPDDMTGADSTACCFQIFMRCRSETFRDVDSEIDESCR